MFESPDIATCNACISELFRAVDRRYLYPFINCTNCGPRLTIITSAPYDRERTTMAAFEMCGDCRREYENPADRRFHAQPIACPRCGPSVTLLDRNGRAIPTSDPIAALGDRLLDGTIAAIKGLGGYHLVCDATNAAAVDTLRRRKHREEKPFAIMVSDLARANDLAELTQPERDLLQSPAAPIVLVRKKQPCAIPEAVAPFNPYLGIMLPYTPLHHLLMRSVQGRALVLTSGNRSDEPIAIDDHDALRRLADIADVFLIHNRPIRVRCDDSVVRIADGLPAPIRRSRGYAPAPINLPHHCPQPILAVSGQLKATFALGRGRHAFLSHHLGDLDHFEAFTAFQRDIDLFEQLFAIQPQAIVHDLHPDYASTRYANDRAAAHRIPAIAVQHHHAHMASCMAEHALTNPVIGVIFDGSGYGTDNTIWGGEFLIGNYLSFTRAAHLRPIAMPGGELAIHQPWRMAAAHLLDADLDLAPLAPRIEHASLNTIQHMLARSINCPITSSAGRLFDAIASLCHIKDHIAYEGQAAIELEWAAKRHAASNAANHHACSTHDDDEAHHDSAPPFPYEIAEQPLPASPPTSPRATKPTAFNLQHRLVIDTRPLIRAVVDDLLHRRAASSIALRFHITIAYMIADICRTLAARTGISQVVLSGGVFMNVLLLRETHRRLARAGLQVFSHHQVPANDGGLSLGQLAIAAALLQQQPLNEENSADVPGHSRPRH